MFRWLWCLQFSLAVSASAAFIVGPEQPASRVSYGPPPGSTPMTAASDGSDFLVVWNRWGSIYASHVSSLGETSPESQVFLASTASSISVCWSGRVYIVAWVQDRGLRTATVSRDGKIATPPRQLISNNAIWSCDIASNGRRSFLAYAMYASASVGGILLDDSGNVIKSGITPPPPVGDIAPLASPVRVATDGEKFAVFWMT